MKSKHYDPSYFFSYDRFILLTKTYFKYLKKGSLEISVPVNIYNTNTSFICYQSLLSHMKDCAHCKNCKDKDIVYLHKCKDLQGILYPYGQYIAENIPTNMYLHNRFTLDDWCLPLHSTLFPLKEESDHDKEDLILPPIINEKNNCSACSNNEKKEKEKEQNVNKNQNTHVFPSQNLFIFENKKEKMNNEYENKQRMNAYAVYPSIKNDYKEERNNKEEDSCRKTSLCKNMKPLFI